MRFAPRIKQVAVTLTELLVVLVIIGILSTIALPAYINQSERARFAAAHQELFEIAQAMDACGIEHGRYVPLQVLDDLPGDLGSQGAGNSDVIKDEAGLLAIDFDQPTNFLVSNGNADLSENSPDPRTATMVKSWGGPFINFQRVYVTPGINQQSVPNKDDFPLDPWGNPYRFYSPVGIVGSTNDGSNNQNFNRISDFGGNLTNQDDHFDRWAIVSWGPDGESDTLTSRNLDDVSYVFGKARAETDFNP